ncbi:LOW QUALITY PROTEIN: hypothetical protein Cgig2_005775 [Carnegiea gigantea]|uniref:Uncharacterized protein n=1 Tax=Carnegiea gigantea TaxID=171969 RepID=A0A9Q1JZ45_9CARY|nr:LOW QUALITY PROTEIN: hypothetical protein Cgig2_005775 [Carnegiea gigantea]
MLPYLVPFGYPNFCTILTQIADWRSTYSWGYIQGIPTKTKTELMILNYCILMLRFATFTRLVIFITTFGWTILIKNIWSTLHIGKDKEPFGFSCQERMGNLNVTVEGELTIFLAFSLSHFVLPYGKGVIRPETFVMAALMASGQQISLAPIVLGYSYHGLGKAISHPNHPGKANINFPNHYLGWVVELFPCLYCRRPDSDYPSNFPSLVCYAGLLVSKLSLPQARHVFKDGRHLSLRARSYRDDSHNERDVIEMRLPDEDFKFLLSIQSFVLPVSVGSELILEPYYPNRDLLANRARDKIFGVVKTTTKTEDLVDVHQLKILSDQDLTRPSKIAYIEDLEKEEDHLKLLIGSVIAFNNVFGQRFTVLDRVEGGNMGREKEKSQSSRKRDKEG